MTSQTENGGTSLTATDEAGANETRPTQGLALRLRRLLVAVALALGVVMAIEQLELAPSFPLTRKMMQSEDIPVLLLSSALLLACAVVGVPAAALRLAPRIASGAHAWIIAAGILTTGIIVAFGTHFFAFDFALSRDEAMAVFDSKIIASGRLLGPVPEHWRAFVPALQPEFRLPIPGDAAWVSSYLPGNAAIRAFLGLVIPAPIGNAVLAIAALVALLGIARKLWPDRHDAVIVAVLLAASSSQLMFMSMTPYAMSAHLALNLIWLRLFMQNTPATHAAAVAVGFLATGLHQIIFHPLFVAPFILQMLHERRWKLCGVYVASYAAIGMFWILYWQVLLASEGLTPQAASSMGLSYLGSRIGGMLANFSFYGLETMTQNLLRFSAWQNPMLLVLLVPGMALAWRTGGVVRSLAGGIVLTLLAMFCLLPYQDLGWGYRYVHGLIGNAALLGAFGWIKLTSPANRDENRAAWGIFGIATAASMFILLPIHAGQMRATIAPYARAQASIASNSADAVIIDSIAIYYGNDLVRNDPDLTNRPLTFDIAYLNETLARDLCSRFSIAIFDGQDAARFGIKGNDATQHSEYVRLRELRSLIESPRCRDLRATR